MTTTITKKINAAGIAEYYATSTVYDVKNDCKKVVENAISYEAAYKHEKAIAQSFYTRKAEQVACEYGFETSPHCFDSYVVYLNTVKCNINTVLDASFSLSARVCFKTLDHAHAFAKTMRIFSGSIYKADVYEGNTSELLFTYDRAGKQSFDNEIYTDAYHAIAAKEADARDKALNHELAQCLYPYYQVSEEAMNYAVIGEMNLARANKEAILRTTIGVRFNCNGNRLYTAEGKRTSRLNALKQAELLRNGQPFYIESAKYVYREGKNRRLFDRLELLSFNLKIEKKRDAYRFFYHVTSDYDYLYSFDTAGEARDFIGRIEDAYIDGAAGVRIYNSNIIVVTPAQNPAAVTAQTDSALTCETVIAESIDNAKTESAQEPAAEHVTCLTGESNQDAIAESICRAVPAKDPAAREEQLRIFYRTFPTWESFVDYNRRQEVAKANDLAYYGAICRYEGIIRYFEYEIARQEKLIAFAKAEGYLPEWITEGNRLISEYQAVIALTKDKLRHHLFGTDGSEEDDDMENEIPATYPVSDQDDEDDELIDSAESIINEKCVMRNEGSESNITSPATKNFTTETESLSAASTMRNAQCLMRNEGYVIQIDSAGRYKVNDKPATAQEVTDIIFDAANGPHDDYVPCYIYNPQGVEFALTDTTDFCIVCEDGTEIYDSRRTKEPFDIRLAKMLDEIRYHEIEGSESKADDIIPASRPQSQPAQDKVPAINQPAQVTQPSIITVSGVRGYVDNNQTVWLNAQDVARGLGFIEAKKFSTRGENYIRWERINGYLKSFGFCQDVGKDSFIPENMFYRLAMKASNAVAEAFQAKVADEILPSIRRHGVYATDDFLAKTISNPDWAFVLPNQLGMSDA